MAKKRADRYESARAMQRALGAVLDRETARFLDRIARDWRERQANGGSRSSKKPPPVPPVPRGRSLKPGTILAREHGGVLHRVVVAKDGFEGGGGTYRSLSEVARAITGTNWNGPRFFGLRDNANPSSLPARRRRAP